MSSSASSASSQASSGHSDSTALRGAASSPATLVPTLSDEEMRSPSFSPSPSPALSAYTYSSQGSCEYDADLAALTLEEAEEAANDATFHPRSESGTATPVPANAAFGAPSPPGSASRLSALRHALNPKRLVAHAHRHGHAAEKGAPLSSTPGYVSSQDELDDEEEEVREELEGEGTGFDVQDEDEEDMHAAGVPAARGWRLDARQMETKAFREKVLDMFSKELRLSGWAEADVAKPLLPLSSDRLKLKRVSGAFSNVVIFASYIVEPEDAVRAGVETLLGPPTVLLRVYGTATEVLLSRRAELLILHTLSSLYEIGPHILGTFANGRVEEYFDCVPIGKDGMRDLGDRTESIVEDGSLLVRGQEGRAQWAARRMRELHEVPLDPIRTVLEQGDLRKPGEQGFGRGIERHLFARAHHPRPQNRMISAPPPRSASYFTDVPIGGPSEGISPSAGPAAMRESPAYLSTVGEGPQSTSIAAAAAAGARAQAMEIQGATARAQQQHRNNSVTSFDSLATSYSSNASTFSVPEVLRSPPMRANSYTDSLASARLGGGTPGDSPFGASMRTSQQHASSRRGSQMQARVPYPGVWRRTKRWSREAAKILAIVDDFARSPEGKEACAIALRGVDFALSPSMPGGVAAGKGIEEGKKAPTSRDIGPTSNLRGLLLAISGIDFGRLVLEMDAFKRYVRAWERKEGQSKRVLTHGDTQYGNLLIRKSMDPERPVATGMPRRGSTTTITGVPSAAGTPDVSTPGTPGAGQPRSRSRQRTSRMAPHERLVVIDMEYLNHGPRAYDIANMFIEMGADYEHPTDSWSMTANGPYPGVDERRRWLRAYAEQGRLMRMRGGKTPKGSFALLPGLSPSSGAVSDAASVPDVAPLPPPLVPLSSTTSSGDAGGAVEQIGALEKSNGQRQPNSRAPSARDVNVARATAGARTPSLSPANALGAKSVRTLSSGSSSGDNSSPRLTGQEGGGGSSRGGQSALARLDASLEREVDRLEREVAVWMPASHAVWALWGITFARERIEALLLRTKEQIREQWQDGGSGLTFGPDDDKLDGAEIVPGTPESFDNLRYALGRVELFRAGIAQLGISL